MYLDTLKFHDFRNLKDGEIKLDKGINVFVGENAQGKTSLLEAITMLSLARSHRTSKEKEVITWEKEFARLEGKVIRQKEALPLELIITKNGKVAKVNHLKQDKLSLFIGKFNVVLFSPEDLALVKGSPSLRRHFLDTEMSQMTVQYLYHSSRYQHQLKQRNIFLKSLRGKLDKSNAVYDDILTKQLIEEAAPMIFQRLAFLKELEQKANQIQQALSEGKEKLSLIYKTSLDLEESKTVDAIKKSLEKKSLEVKDRELSQGVTLFGPHRDDFLVLLNQKNVQQFGSQGQQRSSVLSLKLGEVAYMHQKFDDYPILLLDDVLSELDPGRQRDLLKVATGKAQTILTTTSLEDVRQSGFQAKIWQVKDGKIEESQHDSKKISVKP